MNNKSVLTLSGRVAVVTGGSRGIGLAIAKKFFASGMYVAVLSKSENTPTIVSRHINSDEAKILGIQCDVSQMESVQLALSCVAEHFGGVDVLVNSAGVLDLESVANMTSEHWDHTLSTNLKGTFLTCQRAIPYLELSSAARIINISSNAGRMGGYENGMAYTASKGGVIALTYGLARQLAKSRITVNCIAPGTIESEMSEKWDTEAKERLLVRFPLGRFGTTEEVAAAACYFASEEAGFTTGAVLDVNGGMFTG
jgi:3-oxoacyl-[acyl-carrier protein] reductase